jgi:two-component system chemotaxis response regulator CheY
MTDLLNQPKATRHLDMPDTEPYRPVRAATGPLQPLPWVVEFRVVGTASTLQVQVKESMSLGRSDPANNIIASIDLGPYGGQTQGVSRQHAIILAQDNRMKVKDLGSVNGTRLNGYVLMPHQEYRLMHGDELEIGRMKLQVRFAVVPTMGSTPAGSDVNEAPIPKVGAGEQVLVVEDDSDVGKVFQLALESAGFKVELAENAVQALSMVTKQIPQVMVVDLMLPDMNGLDLVRYIRKMEGGKDIRLVVCSGAAGGFHISQAKEQGADSFLSKPVSVEDLVNAVARLSQVAVPG